MSSDEKIRAVFIIEVLGKPPEHLTEAVEETITSIGKEKGVSIIQKNTNEPREIEGQKELFTTFAEIEAEFDEITSLLVILFKYMPSHFEIISPDRLTLKNSEISELANEVTRRLHAYDEIARVIQFEKSVLENKLRDILEKSKKTN